MKNTITVRIQHLITFTFCLILFCQLPVVLAQTQNNNDGTGVLPNQMYDSRSLSLGSATVADVYGRPSIGINAALSGLFNNGPFVQFNTSHHWDTNLMQHDLTLPTLSAGPHHFTFRLGLLHQGFENLPFTNSSTLTEPDITMSRAQLAYAIALSDYVSIGTLQSVSYTTATEEGQYWNYFADLGLAYAPDGPVSYGLVFRGLGHETTYEITETGQTTLDRRLAGQSLEVGATLRYPIEDRTYLSLSFANEKRFNEDGLWYKGGIEIAPVPYIKIRGGAIGNFDQSLFIPRVGLGINAGMLRIDYMMAPKNLIGEQFHQIGLTLDF